MTTRLILCTLALALAIPVFAGEAPALTEAAAIADLQGTDLGKKDQACRRMAAIGTKAAVPALAALLSDEKMSDVARFGMEPIPDPSVDEAFRAGLGKFKGRQLSGVIMSLGNRRDQASIEPIAKLIADPDIEVATMSARAIGKIGGPAAAKALEAALGSAAAGVKLAVAESYLALADSLLVQGKRDEALPMFERLTKAELPKRLVAASTRGAILCKQDAGLPWMAELLRSGEKEMWRVGFRLAREIQGPAATKALVAEMPKLPPDRQIMLIGVLGERHDPAAAPGIIEIAKSGEVNLRVAALRVMGQIADASIVPVLFTASADANAEVAKAAQATLAGLPASKEINDGIIAVADTGDAKQRVVAINTIADRRVTAALPVLLKSLDDADEGVRSAALRALGETTSVADVDALLGRLMKPKNPQEVTAAEGALKAVFARTEDKQACATKLLAALPQAQGPSKCAALGLLRVVGGAEALAAVKTACKDANAEVQDAAMRALFGWQSAEPAAEVLEIAKTSTNDTYKVLALRGYVTMITIKDLPADKKLAMCKEAMALAKRPDEKKLVLGALGETPLPEALKMIEACQADAATKNEAENALLKISQVMAGTSPDEAKATLKSLIASTGNANLKKQAQQLIQQIDKAGDYVTAWQVTPAYTGQGLFDFVFPPEKPDAKDVKWTLMGPGTDRGGAMIMDLADACGAGDGKAAYVRTWVKSEKEQPAKFDFGTDDGNKVWLNGTQVHANPQGGAATPGKYKVDVTLKAGWNALLMKVVQDTGGWEFCFRICKPDGSKIAGIKLQPTPPGE